MRNLTCGEMADEVLAIEKDTGKGVDRVVVMGSGEPLLNYDELIKFVRILNSPLAFNISFEENYNFNLRHSPSNKATCKRRYTSDISRFL